MVPMGAIEFIQPAPPPLYPRICTRRERRCCVRGAGPDAPKPFGRSGVFREDGFTFLQCLLGTMYQSGLPIYNSDMVDESKPLLLALVADLFFTSRIQSAVDRLGWSAAWVEEAGQVGDTGADFVRLLKKALPALVLVDLSMEALPWEEWVRAAKADPATAAVPVLGFGAHREAERLKQARQAGMDRVVAKSEFTASLPDLIQKTRRESR